MADEYARVLEDFEPLDNYESLLLMHAQDLHVKIEKMLVEVRSDYSFVLDRKEVRAFVSFWTECKIGYTDDYAGVNIDALIMKMDPSLPKVGTHLKRIS